MAKQLQNQPDPTVDATEDALDTFESIFAGSVAADEDEVEAGLQDFSEAVHADSYMIDEDEAAWDEQAGSYTREDEEEEIVEEYLGDEGYQDQPRPEPPQQNADPLYQALAQHPDLAEELLRRMNGNEVRAKEPPPQPLVKPTKPQNYSRYDALNNEESESAKYDMALQAWQEQAVERAMTRAEQAERALNEEKETRNREETMKEQQRAQNAAMVQELTSKHGMNPQEAADFQRFVNSTPVTLDNLVTYYRAIRGVAPKKPRPSRAADAGPSPVTQGVGTRVAEDDGVDFTNSLINFRG